MKIGSLVKLNEYVKQDSEHLYADPKCLNESENVLHWSGIRRGELGLVVGLVRSIHAYTTCRLFLSNGKSGWIRAFYLTEVE